MMTEGQNLKILVIDDEAPIRHSLKEFLEDYDFAVVEADSAEAALLLIKNQEFDVAIVDLRLPGISGDLFILQANKFRQGLRYIIHTGSVGYRLSLELMDLGLKTNDVFRKPVENMYRFVEKINELLARSKGD